MSPAFRNFLAAPFLLVSYIADFFAYHAYYAAKAIAGEQARNDDDEDLFV